MNADRSTTVSVRLPKQPVRLPGVTYRLLRHPDDWPAIAELIAEANTVDDVDWFPSPGSLAVEHVPNHDRSRDHVLVELDGRLVGHAKTSWAERGGLLTLDFDVLLHPTVRRHGLGSVLADWAERQLVERTESVVHGPRAFQVWAHDSQLPGRAFLEGRGYEPVRYFAEMSRDLAAPIPELALPEGIESRPVETAHQRAIFDAEREAFRDHWGYREQTDDDMAAYFSFPDIDTSLWQVAWAGDEVVGVVSTWIFPDENERLGVDRGWLERISVRRPWRKRGVASALTAAAMRALAARGIAEAMLGVDSENPTGAFSLYESLGFRVARQARIYRRLV